MFKSIRHNGFRCRFRGPAKGAFKVIIVHLTSPDRFLLDLTLFKNNGNGDEKHTKIFTLKPTARQIRKFKKECLRK